MRSFEKAITEEWMEQLVCSDHDIAPKRMTAGMLPTSYTFFGAPIQRNHSYLLTPRLQVSARSAS